MATKKNAKPAQIATEQKPQVQNVATVEAQSAKPAANESGKPKAPVTNVAIREAFNVDIEAFRKAFADSARADTNADSKAAVCADLFVTIKTWDELKAARRHAIYGYIIGRAGKRSADEYDGMKKGSDHPLYTVAANAVKRAMDRAIKQGWQAPEAPNAGTGGAPKKNEKTPGRNSDLLVALNKLIATDEEFTTALSYIVANPGIFKAWARSSQEAAVRNVTLKLAA
ncbi:hypothetical protein [Paraburkholderia dinghuensis]|uniref:Uncharacterized protein n=1 Tax=Paraburkholderia dinghuensis TaxID=2305225 RepID=A0A3N6N4M7_9BURK|nr:hypothetical protein [Paraburkholderia dinghuensis]RQH02727.1 hypothetical protein D1Y85_21580 [Paraburkholderia dinghuensis]